MANGEKLNADVTVDDTAAVDRAAMHAEEWNLMFCLFWCMLYLVLFFIITSDRDDDDYLTTNAGGIQI